MKRWLFGVLGVGLAGLYYRFDPARYAFFPPCPFRWLTGLPCPGCGSQRCVHQLLHGHWPEALALHPLLVLSLPYVLVGLLVEYTPLRARYPAIRRNWYGRVAARVALLIVLVWWALRLLFWQS